MDMWGNECDNQDNTFMNMQMNAMLGLAIGKAVSEWKKRKAEDKKESGASRDEADNGRFRDNPGRE